MGRCRLSLFKNTPSNSTIVLKERMKQKAILLFCALSLVLGGTLLAADCQNPMPCCNTDVSCARHCTLSCTPDNQTSIEPSATLKTYMPLLIAIDFLPTRVIHQIDHFNLNSTLFSPQSCWDIQNQFIKLQC